MQWKSNLLAVLACIATSVAFGVGTVTSVQADPGMAGIEVDAGALYLERSDVKDRNLTILGTVVTSTASDLELDGHTGGYLSVIATPRSFGGISFHVGGFVVDDDARADLGSAGAFLLFSDGDVGLPGQPFNILKYDTSLKSVEANVRYNMLMPERATAVWLSGGLRIVQLDENFTLNQFGPVTTAAIGSSADNDLVGAQIGVSARHEFSERFAIRATANAAVLYNEMNSVSQGVINGIVQPPVHRSSDADTSTLLEAGLDVSYEIVPGIGVFVGGQVLHISDVALAIDQPGVQNTPAISPVGTGVVATDDVLYYGVRAGIKIKLN